MSLDLDNLFACKAARPMKDEHQGVIYFFVRQRMDNVGVKKVTRCPPARFTRRKGGEPVCHLQRLRT